MLMSRKSDDATAQIKQLRKDIAALAGTLSLLAERQAKSVAGDIAGSVQDHIGDRVQALAAQLSDRLSASADKVSALSDATRETATDLIDSVTSDVRKNPVRALLIAGAVGAFVALLTRSGGK